MIQAPALLALGFWLSGVSLGAQDASIRETFAQAKTLWTTQGDRDAAAAKFEQVLQALDPRSGSIEGEPLALLCEAYNWLAVLDDRSPSLRAKVARHLETILNQDPNFELDKGVTPSRIQTQYESLRSARCARIKLSISPEGGVLRINGRPAQPAPSRYIAPGRQTLSYARPGYRPIDLTIELAAKEMRPIEMNLERVSSTVAVMTSPPGTEILLDDRSLGRSQGRVPPEFKDLADKAGIPADRLSAPLVVQDLKPGKHILEFRAPCHRTRRVELGEEFAKPFADHVLKPVKLEEAKGTLSISSSWEGGELFLSAQSQGRLPLVKLPVCAGSYDLVVRFPFGGYSQPIQIQDKQHQDLVVRPKPRLAFVGIEGGDEFPGKTRLAGQFAALSSRLKEVAWVPPAPGESPAEALTRIQTTKDAELFLRAIPFQNRNVFQVELVLSTLNGEEERMVVKPLGQDPLATLVAKLNSTVPLSEPWMGLVLIDVPGEQGPWVLQAEESAVQAGIQPLKALHQIDGRPVTSVAEARSVLLALTGTQVSVQQGDQAVQLPLRRAPREIPTHAAGLSYPRLLADLRLRALSAKGEDLAYLKLNQALALINFRAFDKSLEILRETRLPATPGINQGTVDYYSGICLGRLGSVYTSEAIQAYARAQAVQLSTLFGPAGPAVAPLARQASEELKP